jgi:hypothetical protein
MSGADGVDRGGNVGKGGGKGRTMFGNWDPILRHLATQPFSFVGCEVLLAFF